MPGTAKKIVLSLCSLLLALAVGEGLLRVTGFGRVTPQLSFDLNTRNALKQGRFEADPDLLWRLPTTPADRLIRAVNPTVTIPPATNAKRILVLGDSCSRLAVDGPPYSVYLEQGLGSGGDEVWNASVPGYTSYQGLVWFGRQLAAMQARTVIVYFGWNDHWRTTGLTDRETVRRQGNGSLRLAALLKSRPEVPPLRVPVSQYRENLEALLEEISASAGQALLVTAPYRFTGENVRRLRQTGYLMAADDPRVLHEEYLAVVRDLARRKGTLFLDAARLFADLAEDGLLHRDGIHLTDSGHRVMAACLAHVIEPGQEAADLAGVARRTLARTDGQP